MKKKLLAIISLICAFVCTVSLAACGNKPSGPVTTGTLNKDQSGNVIFSNVSIKLSTIVSGDDEAPFRQIVQQFNNEYRGRINVEITNIAQDNFDDTVQQQIAQNNNPPDLILGGDVHIQSQSRYLMPLNDLIEQDAEEVDYDDFIPGITEMLTLNGNIYYLPEFFNVSLLYYNKDKFDEYNANPANSSKQVEYPQADWTYEEFYETADKLTVRSGNSVSQFGCYSVIGWWGEWLIHVRQAGGDFMNEEGWVTLNTDEAVEGMQPYYDKMYGTHRKVGGRAEEDKGL